MSEDRSFRRSNRIANLNRKPAAPERNLQPFAYINPNLRKIKLECDYVPVTEIKIEPNPDDDGPTLLLEKQSKRKKPKVIDLTLSDDDVLCLSPKETLTKGTKCVEVDVILILKNNGSSEESSSDKDQQHEVIFENLPVPLIDTHRHQDQFITLNCIIRNDIGEELSLKVSTFFKEENWDSSFNERLKAINVVIGLKPDFFAHISQKSLDESQVEVDDSWTQFCKKHYLI